MYRKLYKFLPLSLCSVALFVNMAHATSLHQAVEHTLTTNPEYLVKDAQKKQVQQDLWKSRGGFLPKVDLVGSDGRERSLNFSTLFQWAHLNRKDLDLKATQNLFSGFKTIYDIKKGHAQVESADHSIHQTQQELALSAIESYLDILKNKQLVEIARENVATHIATFLIIKKRTTVGVSSRSERELTAGRVAVSKARYYDAVKDQHDGVATYVKVVGWKPTNLSMPKSYVPGTDVSLTHAMASAIHNNPVLKKAKSDVLAELYAYRSNRFPFYPSFDFEVDRFRGENIGGIEGRRYNTVVLVRATWNLFNGGIDAATLKESAYKKVEAEDEALRLGREVIEETVEAYNQLKNLKESLPQYREHVDKISFVLIAYRKQYVAGKRTLLDVLNIENELYNAKKQYISSKYDIILARYILLDRMGMILPALGVFNSYRY